MRVAIVTAGEVAGGVERHVEAFCAELDQSGIEPVVYLFHKADLYRRLVVKGLQVNVLPSGIAAVRRLRRALQDQRIQLVHTHGYKAGIVAGLATARSRVSMVKTEHSRPLYASLRWDRRSIYELLDLVTTRMRRPFVVYVTEELRRGFRFLHAGIESTRIYNGLPDPGWSCQSDYPGASRSEPLKVIAIGRLVPIKGFDVALRALAHPECPPVKLRLAGDGPIMGSLQALAADLGVGGQVEFLGHCDNVAAQLDHTDAVLIPSLHEGLPYTLIEALAAAKPVVASGVGGLAEVLEDGATALIVNPQDPAAIAGALRRLSESPELRKALGASGRAQYEAQFGSSSMAKAYVSLYYKVTEAPAVEQPC